MPDHTGKVESPNLWPLPKFSFRVNLGAGQSAVFQEVTGLDSETQIIEYRHSNSPAYSTIKMPGLKKFGNVTLKKGVFIKDDAFWTWYSQITMNTITRRSVVIELLDETGAATMTWIFNNAWPTKISSTDLKSDGNEVAIETIELAYETLTIANR